MLCFLSFKTTDAVIGGAGWGRGEQKGDINQLIQSEPRNQGARTNPTSYHHFFFEGSAGAKRTQLTERPERAEHRWANGDLP
jgi:hypothetical protein